MREVDVKYVIVFLSVVLILFVIATDFQDKSYFHDFGGGEYIFAECGGLPEESIQAMAEKYAKKIEALKAQGIIPIEPIRTLAAQTLSWPLTSSTTDYSYYATRYFVDHDSDYPNHLLDYNNGTRTYDLPSGFNHSGTDYVLWPFEWHKMADDEVQVVAAAAGYIIDRQDGYYDKFCDLDDEYFNDWNGIILSHAGGYQSWYLHFKDGSVTNKAEGEYVEAGEYLGIVGSSGYTYGPHLHFLIYDGGVIDPYIGPVNPNPDVTWLPGEQRPYYDSAINKVMTHSTPPDFSVECPTPATINEQDDFYTGDSFYVAAYYRDQMENQVSQYTIYKPDNSIFDTWTHSIDDPHYFASYWYWGFTLPSNAPTGTWKFEVVYEGQTYEHNFSVSEDTGLPVGLVSFVAQAGNSEVLLQWETASEINNLGFILLRSREKAGQYEEISSYVYNEKLQGAGSTSTTHLYAHIDKSVQNGLTYWYKLIDVDYSGTQSEHPAISVTLSEDRNPRLANFALFQSFPNPFNLVANIAFNIPEDFTQSRIRLEIYDMSGTKIKTILDTRLGAGYHSATWDATNDRNETVSSGVYIYELIVSGDKFIKQQKKILLLK